MTQIVFRCKKYANDNSAKKKKWAYWDDMTFLQEHIAAEEEQEPELGL